MTIIDIVFIYFYLDLYLREVEVKNMNIKIIGIISFLLMILLLTPIANSQYVTKNNNSSKSSIDWHTTFFASIYTKLDSDASQMEDIINNWNNPPKHFLTDIYNTRCQL